MPPGQSQRAAQLRKDADNGELPYISKSRLKSYVTCPRKFYIKYVAGFPTEDNWHLRKGTHLHTVFEEFYDSVASESQKAGGELDDIGPLIDHIPMDGDLFWAPFIKHVNNFLKFEARRMEEAYGLADYMPASVEEEMWLDDPPILDSPPWYGYTDLIVNSWTVPEVEANNGATIVDFKTGKVPDPQYREKGIHLENEFYATIATSLGYNVTGLVGYYPQEDTVIATESSANRSIDVDEYIEEMIDIESPDDAPQDPQPLCRWGYEDDECCDFYDDSPAPWDGPDDGSCDTPWGRKETNVGPNYI